HEGDGGNARVPGADEGQPRFDRRDLLLPEGAAGADRRRASPGRGVRDRAAGRHRELGARRAHPRSRVGAGGGTRRDLQGRVLGGVHPRALRSPSGWGVWETGEARRARCPARSFPGGPAGRGERDMTRADLHARGKVRDIFEAGGDLLMVATDRISAFDVVLSQAIPDKGRVLTGLSLYWFDRTAHLVANHLIAADAGAFPEPFGDDREWLAGRAMQVRRADVVPIECVARGY